jgi:hypothetical protein
LTIQPLLTESRQPLLARKQLMHGGLLDIMFLGDELVEGAYEGVDVAQSGGDGALFVNWR